jgi:hypothetical protein
MLGDFIWAGQCLMNKGGGLMAASRRFVRLWLLCALAWLLQLQSAHSTPFGAIMVSATVNFSASGISTDSFNSTNLVKFPGGLYNVANRQDNGDVVTLSNASSINIKNGSVRGRLHAASGTVDQVQINGGTVGSNGWFNAGNAGIEPGCFKADVNFTFSDASLPDTGGKIWLPPAAVPGGFTINGVTYKYVLNNSSPWKIGTLDGGVYVASSNVVLWVTDGISLGPNDQIRITGNGSLNLYVTAPTANIGGNGIVNDTGLAKNFHYYGLPLNTSLGFGANVSFTGIIYAPEADFYLGGGGNNTYDFIGQSVTKSASMNGHFNFHYDEALSSSVVYAPPLILAQPTNLVVMPGTNVTFGISLIGSPPFQFQWLFNGTNILDATNASYSIPSVAASNAGSYSVIVSNVAGSVTSSNAWLTVFFSPTVALQVAGGFPVFLRLNGMLSSNYAVGDESDGQSV